VRDGLLYVFLPPLTELESVVPASPPVPGFPTPASGVGGALALMFTRAQ